MINAKAAVAVLCGAFLLAFVGTASAQVAATQDGGVKWQAGVNGVTIEWNDDGSVKRIYSEYAQAVSFPDRRGINRAHIIAQEKAKAEIVRFMGETVTQNRTITTIDAELEKATRTVSSDGDSFNRESKREMMESLAEVTNSYASGSLSGVIVLEKGYNEQREEAWVKVGISNRTVSAAQAVGQMVAPQRQGARQGEQRGQVVGSAPRQESEVIRSSQEDW